MSTVVQITLGLLPVLAFLGALIYLDTFKLVRLRSILVAILTGAAVAAICSQLNPLLQGWWQFDSGLYSRYPAPVIEEGLKALFVIFIIRTGRVGFLVDSAIYGFAVGTGFALVENMYYLHTLDTVNLLLWVVRGFGTAIMHGGTAAIMAIISKQLSDRHQSRASVIYAPGLLTAAVIHSMFNHFVLPPLFSTLALLVVFPVLIFLVYERSEHATRKWLGIGLDTETDLLKLITSGGISSTGVGRFLSSLRTTFPGEVVADMLCYLRIYLELAIRAKGLLLMREAGFPTISDAETKEKLSELKYLEQSIGKAGRLALHPILRTSNRDLWQVYFLDRV